MTCSGLERKKSRWQHQASKDIEKAIEHFLHATILTFGEGVQAPCTCICIIIRILHEFVFVFWTGWLNGILLTGGSPDWHPRQAPRSLSPSQSVAPTISTCVCICNLSCICICICISNHQDQPGCLLPSQSVAPFAAPLLQGHHQVDEISNTKKSNTKVQDLDSSKTRYLLIKKRTSWKYCSI